MLRRLLLALVMVFILFLVFQFLILVIAPVFAGVPLVAGATAFLSQWGIAIAVAYGIVWYLAGWSFFGRAV